MNYCGIDLASKASAVCIIDDEGRTVREFEVATDEDGLRTRFAPCEPMRCVVEASPLAEWVAQQLEAMGHEVVVIDPRRAKAVVGTKKKTDQLNARDLAQMARTGWYTAVHRKSETARLMRTMLKARSGLLEGVSAQRSRVLGLLRAHGIRVTRAKGDGFGSRVLEVVGERAPELEPIVQPLLGLWRQARSEAAAMRKQIEALAQADPVCQLLMTIPGVGPIVATAYVATIDDPHRFAASEQVSDYVGLVPSVYQSGEVDYRGRITKEGDAMLRWLLVEAATVLLTRVKRSCALQRWGRRLIARKGMAKARVAVARKLSALLHRMWVRGEVFDWARA
jgi:transposase